LDIVGIGNINMDYIVESKGPIDPRNFEPGRQRAVSKSDIDDALRDATADGLRITPSPGGSAANVIAGVASVDAGLRTGFVGMRGAAPAGEDSLTDWFSILGTDTEFVGTSDTCCGICVSRVYRRERSMLTYGGANAELPNYLQSNFDSILKYLKASRFVHVTSFTNPEVVPIIGELLKRLREESPAIEISCDTGALWATGNSDVSKHILERASLIMINYTEFEALSDKLPHMPDLVAARKIFKKLPALGMCVVLKDYNRIGIYTPVGSEITERTYKHPHELRNEDIIDDTGAGDAFAAGFATGLLVPGFKTSESIEFGLRLARLKLSYPGTTEHIRLKDEYNSQCVEIVGRRRAATISKPVGRRVFIGYGHDPEWHEVRDQVERWGLTPTFFKRTSVAGRFTNNILAQQAFGADFAVIVLSGDDMTANGDLRARENAVHEVGLMQGKLGFERVAIMLEDRITLFTNLEGLQVLRFARGQIDRCFHDLQGMLVREGLLHPPAAE
jgi:sugar/nucleoside kinase (ribokinase family)